MNGELSALNKICGRKFWYERPLYFPPGAQRVLAEAVSPVN